MTETSHHLRLVAGEASASPAQITWGVIAIEDIEKIELFRSIFAGRTDCYGSETSGCVKSPVTEGVIRSHLTGQRRMGVYPIMTGSTTWWIAADFDDDDIDTSFSDSYLGGDLI
jgi:hypothetical protein